MPEWEPFTLSPEQYREFKDRWVGCHPGAVEDGSGAESRDD